MSERELQPWQMDRFGAPGGEYYEDGFDLGGPKAYRYNANNEAVISLTRHGEKTPEGDLSVKGHQQAIEQGKSRELIGTRVKGYRGPAKRTGQMVETITDTEVGQADLTKDDFEKLNTRTRTELDYEPLSPAFLAEWKKRGKDALQWYIDQPFPFDGRTIEASQLANRAGNLIDREIRMVGKLNSGSKINLENASHSPTLDVFVAKALYKEIQNDPVNPEGTTIIEKMGGGFKEGENFQIKARTDANGRLTATATFRGKEYPINFGTLGQMAGAWRENPFKQFNKQERERIAKKFSEFQPTGDIVADLKAFYELKRSDLMSVFIYIDQGLNTSDPEMMYGYLKERSKVETPPPDADEFVQEHIKAMERIIAAYEAKKK